MKQLENHLYEYELEFQNLLVFYHHDCIPGGKMIMSCLQLRRLLHSSCCFSGFALSEEEQKFIKISSQWQINNVLLPMFLNKLQIYYDQKDNKFMH